MIIFLLYIQIRNVRLRKMCIFLYMWSSNIFAYAGCTRNKDSYPLKPLQHRHQLKQLRKLYVSTFVSAEMVRKRFSHGMISTKTKHMLYCHLQ